MCRCTNTAMNERFIGVSDKYSVLSTKDRGHRYAERQVGGAFHVSRKSGVTSFISLSESRKLQSGGTSARNMRNLRIMIQTLPWNLPGFLRRQA